MLIFDAVEPGFGVRVTRDDKRVFIFQYRVGTRVRRHRIGVWGQGNLTTSKARKEAERLRGLVHNGHDPVADKRAQLTEAAAARRQAQELAAVKAFTFEKLVEGWQTRGIAHRRASYVADAISRLRNYFSPWLKRSAGEITRGEAIQALDRIQAERGTISARRALAYVRAAYGWALKRDLVEANPFAGIAAVGKENPRDRVLTNAEIADVWRAAGLLDPMPGSFVKLLLLTLQRRGEVAGMRWDELAPDFSSWTIPAHRAKNGKAHLVHLSPAAQAVLRAVPSHKGVPFVFVSRTRGPIGGSGYLKRVLVEAMQPGRKARALAAADGKPKPPAMVTWRFHDFRRTGVTNLAGLGIQPHVADKLLNHVTGTIQGVAAVYQRAEFLKERKHAIEAWAAHVLACAEGSDN